MDTPEFNQRFSILLEAYLRGCGESMFVSSATVSFCVCELSLSLFFFTHTRTHTHTQKELQAQHKAVCDIMSVASRVSQSHDHHLTIT